MDLLQAREAPCLTALSRRPSSAPELATNSSKLSRAGGGQGALDSLAADARDPE